MTTATLRWTSRRFCKRNVLVRLFSAETVVNDIPDDISKLLNRYRQKSQTSVSLQTLMKTGKGELLGKTYKDDHDLLQNQSATESILQQVAGFIRREMPIRLAHRINDLDRVPMMRDMPSVQAVKAVYIDSFLELIDQPKITSMDVEGHFAGTLQQLYMKHSNVLIQMAKGAYELREAIQSGEVQGTSQMGSVEFARMDECHSFLDNFYMSRIGIRVLVGQYLALRGEPIRDYVGMISSRTSAYEIVEHAAHDASRMCTRRFGDAPEVNIEGRLDLTFAYIPTHLHYILLELLKNAMRATCENHGVYGDLPPITVIIADGTENEDVVIKVTDEGGGIPRSQVDKIWSYLFTTASPTIQETFIADRDHSADSPLAGLGYGLPISRSYARYFGGDLDIMSMEGYGTDAFVHLTRLGDSREPLPV